MDPQSVKPPYDIGLMVKEIFLVVCQWSTERDPKEQAKLIKQKPARFIMSCEGK